MLLTLVESDDLSAYGWLQLGESQQNEFWWIDARPWVCLGSYWTHERVRGRGIYGRMLSHSLAECASRFAGRPLYIWARSENTASIRGIEKAGFVSIGRHRIVTYAFGLIRRHTKVSDV